MRTEEIVQDSLVNYLSNKNIIIQQALLAYSKGEIRILLKDIYAYKNTNGQN